MERHFLRVEDGACVIGGQDGALSIGSVDAVVEAVGGEEYVLEYDEEATTSPWLETDAEGRITVEVVSAMDDLPMPPGVYEEIERRSENGADGDGERVEYLAAVLTRIWDSKGSVEPDELAALGEE